MWWPYVVKLSVCHTDKKLCRIGRRYQATLHLSGGSTHGLTLDLGVYVARIAPGSAAAKEGSIAVGDRILMVTQRKGIKIELFPPLMINLPSGFLD